MQSTKVDTTKLLTVRSYALRYGITVQSVYNWAKEKRIKIREIDGVKFFEI